MKMVLFGKVEINFSVKFIKSKKVNDTEQGVLEVFTKELPGNLIAAVKEYKRHNPEISLRDSLNNTKALLQENIDAIPEDLKARVESW